MALCMKTVSVARIPRRGASLLVASVLIADEARSRALRAGSGA
jgi:hypothetical protein